MSTTTKQQRSFLDALYNSNFEVLDEEREQSRGFKGSRYAVRSKRGDTVEFYEDSDGDITAHGEDSSVDDILTNIDTESYNIARSLN